MGLVVIADAERGDEPTAAAHTLCNLVDRRHGRVSAAVTSNIGLSDWGLSLGDDTLVAAIPDRASALCAALSPLVSAGTSVPRTPDASAPPGDARTALA